MLGHINQVHNEILFPLTRLKTHSKSQNLSYYDGYNIFSLSLLCASVEMEDEDGTCLLDVLW